ncbi:MAG: sigma-70 family RNA polymerase sigma factor [Patescibacteria group bacterium]
MIDWPSLYHRLMVQAILDGFIELSTLEAVTLNRHKFLQVLEDLHIWLVNDDIANWLRLYHDTDWLTKEHWLVAAASSVKQRAIRSCDQIKDWLISPVPESSTRSSRKRMPGGTPLIDLGLPDSALTSFAKYKITTISGLARFSLQELKRFHYMFDPVVEKIGEKLAHAGWPLATNADVVWRSRFEGQEIKADKAELAKDVLGERDFELFRMIREATDPDLVIQARNELLQRHNGLAFQAARNYAALINDKDQAFDFDDVLQEARIGLISAIEHFDVERGFRFSGLAHRWMKTKILNLINKNTMGCLPAHKVERAKKLEQRIDRLWEELGRKPMVEDVMKATGWKAEKIQEYTFYLDLLNRQGWLSWDLPLGEDGNSTLDDIIADDVESFGDDLISRTFQECVTKTLSDSQLLHGDQWLIKQYWGFEGKQQSAQNLAKALGCDLETVVERLSRAHDMLRTEQFWDKIKWFFPNDHMKSFEEILPKFVQLERSIAGRIQLSQLNDRQREILKHRFGIWGAKQKSLEELGSQFNITRERIRQIEKRALKVLGLDPDVLGLTETKSKFDRRLLTLSVECMWPIDEVYAVLIAVGRYCKVPFTSLLERGNRSHHIAVKEAKLLAGLIFRIRGVQLPQICSILRHSGQSSVHLEENVGKMMERLASSHRFKAEVIGIITEINRYYSASTKLVEETAPIKEPTDQPVVAKDIKLSKPEKKKIELWTPPFKVFSVVSEKTRETFYLHAMEATKGFHQTVYFFCKDTRIGAQEMLPYGYEVFENSLGLPMLRKTKTQKGV